MATKYWHGDSVLTGDWTVDAYWSTTSGGSSDTTAPTSSDDVIFDSNSHTCFVGSVGATCRNFTCTSGSSTLTINNTLAVVGTFNMTAWTLVLNGTLTLISDCTIRPTSLSGTGYVVITPNSNISVTLRDTLSMYIKVLPFSSLKSVNFLNNAFMKNFSASGNVIVRGYPGAYMAFDDDISLKAGCTFEPYDTSTIYFAGNVHMDSDVNLIPSGTFYVSANATYLDTNGVPLPNLSNNVNNIFITVASNLSISGQLKLDDILVNMYSGVIIDTKALNINSTSSNEVHLTTDPIDHIVWHLKTKAITKIKNLKMSYGDFQLVS